MSPAVLLPKDARAYVAGRHYAWDPLHGWQLSPGLPPPQEPGKRGASTPRKTSQGRRKR